MLQNWTLRRFNNVLTVVVVVVGLYITIMPVLPTINLWINRWLDDSNGFRYQSSLASSAGVNEETLAEPPEANTLLIPGIQVDEGIREGQSINVIADGGVWRRPGTSTPDQGGNTVIVGHRFDYTNPPAFYHLDKINVGERFAVFWNQQEYIYEVFESSIVPATAIQIEQDTEEPILTLYTCTPVWTAKDRLVIKSELIKSPETDQTTERLGT